jgi:hypothetical protein
MMRRGMIDICTHANDRMNLRGISLDDIEDIILNGNYDYAKKEGPETRYEFKSHDNKRVIVALGEKIFFPTIVTVISN